MISVSEAYSIVIQNLFSSNEITVNFEKSLGRYLRESIFSDRDFPPYDRVSMDGIAIDFEAFANGKRSFVIQDIQAAGSPRIKAKSSEFCIEAMTGAILPEGCDTVVKYEDLKIANQGENKIAEIEVDEVLKGQNVHLQGTDKLKGDEIISSGTLISPAEIQVIASVGKMDLKVSELPKTMVISTGDELVDVNVVPEQHQIRKSNNYGIGNALKAAGINVDYYHLPDRKDAIINALNKIFTDYELVILSGGVSKGQLDHIPHAMEQLGVRKLFHKVSQRPGKPFWFGRTDTNFIFALPGNPVSTFMCFCKYIKPWLIQSSKGNIEIQKVVLSETIEFEPNLTYFVPVKISYHQEGLKAVPFLGSGSGDLTNMVNADGFMELPSESSMFQRGESFPFHPYR